MGAQAGRLKKGKTTTMPENVFNLVSMPPPPSPTKITEEQVLAPQSVSPLDLCKSAMTKAVKAKFDKDRDLQEFIEKLPEIFMSAHKISTKAPLFKTGGYQPGHEFQSRTFATITSTFERNPDKEAEVIACRTSTITSTVPHTDPLATALNGGK